MLKIEIDKRCEDVNLHPTDPQKTAGNYKMGHISVKGMKIAIENPAGSRRYYGNNGQYNVMKNHYGYFNVTKGKDGDAVDVFLGPDVDDFENVYCIDQNKANGEFDETKVMLGFGSKEEAKEAYLSNYSPDWKGFRDITSVSIKDFKKWLYRGRKQRQPFADYVYIQKKKLDESSILTERYDEIMKKNNTENSMKRVIKLNESDIMKLVKNAIKKTIKEAYTTDDVIDVLGADDSHDGPTNDGADWDEQVYYKALEIMKKFEYGGDTAIDAVEHVMYTYLDHYKDEKLMAMSPDEAAKLIAREAMKSIDRDYFESEVEPLMEGKKTIKLSENDVRSIIRNSVMRILKERREPSKEDWDDFGFWASSDEPDLVNDEISDDYEKEHPEFLIDSDDEGEGYSRDYQRGVDYAEDLIAKNRVPENAVAELEEKEKLGTISAFELGILDTIADEN